MFIVRIYGRSSCTWMHIPGNPSDRITLPDNWTFVSSSKKNELHMACPSPGGPFLLRLMTGWNKKVVRESETKDEQ